MRWYLLFLNEKIFLRYFMKGYFGKVRLGYVILIFAFLFGVGILSCSNETKNGTNNGNQTENPDDKTQKEPEQPAVISDSFFWGTWVRMDNGTEYEVLESNIVQGNKNYAITDSDETSLTVNSIGTFKKESDSVIICDNIPYFRKGGANLEYSLKIVGFTSSGAATSSISEISSATSSLSSRAAGTEVRGIKGKGKSTKYKNFEFDSESDEDGRITFTAPTANDPQTVEITNGDEIVVIPGLSITNSGDNMGTVALVGKNDYNLKITGKISDDQKDGGYLFGNNAKTYEMEIKITNVSENKCKSSICTISPASPNLSIASSDTNLEGFTISTLASGATKIVKVSVVYGELTEPYIDTGLNIKITNQSSNKEWNDYIPLRFFKGTIPITIAAKNPENNNTAALNGFVIYPDGNNKFFMVEHNGCKPVFVPTFGNNKPYKLVFSGATVTSRLDDSTEMYYTVEPISISPRTVITDGDPQKQLEYMNFGGDNHSEDTAYPATQGFESYLSEGEIDYYTICADSEDYYGPKGGAFYSVSYVNEKGDAPETFLTSDGAVLSIIQLPQLKCDGYEFLGWYKGNTKVIAGSYAVKENITLTAKWQLTSYPVVYNLNGGTNSAANPSAYTIESSEISLAEPVRTGYKFEGWFSEKDFSGRAVESIGGGSIGGITLYAKWTPIIYKISYVLDDGKNADVNPAEYTIESATSTLGEPEKDGYLFGGWFETSDFSGDKLTEIASGSYGDKTFYAKWMKKCIVKYVSEYGDVPEEIVVGAGMTLTEEQLPRLTDEVLYFRGWYKDETLIQAGKFIVTDDIIFIALWKDWCEPELTTTVKILPNGSDGTAGNKARYVLFGDWPQTIKVDNVTVDENITEEHGMLSYYLGSDDCWYVKCIENAHGSDKTYSNGITVEKSSSNSIKYFKVEPIKWRILTFNYNGTENALLLSEKILTANIEFYCNESGYYRRINDKKVYKNNYKESKIRAYLNGQAFYRDPLFSWSDKIYDDTFYVKGFLQSAFTIDAQDLIVITNVNNNALSTFGSSEKGTYNSYACANTNDKIFLLSENEVTTSLYEFNNSVRKKTSTEYALANYSETWWWLRSPSPKSETSVSYINSEGSTGNYTHVGWSEGGIVPALTIKIPSE